MAVPDRAGAEGSEVGKDNSTATRGFEELPGYGRPIAVITLTNRLDDKGSQFVGPAVGAPQTPAGAMGKEVAARRWIGAEQGKTYHTRRESKAWKIHGQDRMLRIPNPDFPERSVLNVLGFSARDVDLVKALAQVSAAPLSARDRTQ